MKENKLSVEIYLPWGAWYHYHSKQPIISTGQNITLPAPINVIPILIRGGGIIPQQKPNRTTVYSRQSKIDILCAPDTRGYASGTLFWDDGDSLSNGIKYFGYIKCIICEYSRYY